jgi:hypothetical protein
MLQQTVELEVAEYIERHQDLRDGKGLRLVVRNVSLPQREILCGVGPVGIKQPRVHDRREGQKFSSKILPPYLRRVPSIDALIPARLVKLRDERIVRFIGFSAHSYFGKAMALISSDGFDLCMLSYGYIPRGWNQVFSARMTELRNTCVAKAHELGMGIVAMKVVGGGILGAWSQYIVPGFDKERLGQLPAAAIRHVLQDERVHILNISMRLKEEVDANIKILAGDGTYTLDDRALLAEFSVKALDRRPLKAMRVD